MTYPASQSGRRHPEHSHFIFSHTGRTATKVERLRSCSHRPRDALSASFTAMHGGRHENQRNWDPSEDIELLTLVQSYGPKWVDIEKAFNGSKPLHSHRTHKSLRNRHIRLVKGEEKMRKGMATNRCAKCRGLKAGHTCPIDNVLVTRSSPSVPSAASAVVSFPAAMPQAITAPQWTRSIAPSGPTEPTVEPPGLPVPLPTLVAPILGRQGSMEGLPALKPLSFDRYSFQHLLMSNVPAPASAVPPDTGSFDALMSGCSFSLPIAT